MNWSYYSPSLRRGGANGVDLIDDLWPESDGGAARYAFRVRVHRLRKKSVMRGS